MNKKLLYITNIPTPYRNFRFNALSETCAEHGFDLHVLYMNWAEPDRAWTIDKSDMKHEYEVFSSNKVKKALGMWLHFTPKLHWHLLRNKYDVAVLGGLASPAHFFASLLLKKNKTNVLSVESNLASIGNRSGLATKVKTFLMRRFTHFQITGEKAKEFILHYHPDAQSNNMVALPNIINEPLFESAPSELLPDYVIKQLQKSKQNGYKTLLIPARLIEEKGLMPFFSVLRSDDPLFIVVAGDGPLRNELSQFVEQEHLNVAFLGAQTPETTAALMKNVDFLCLPSKSDPSPLSVIEACAVGLPILASKNIGNFDEVVDEDVNGWGFDFGDPLSTRAAVDKLINSDADQRDIMSKAAKVRFAEQFHSKHVLNRYIDELKAISNRT